MNNRAKNADFSGMTSQHFHHCQSNDGFSAVLFDAGNVDVLGYASGHTAF